MLSKPLPALEICAAHLPLEMERVGQPGSRDCESTEPNEKGSIKIPPVMFYINYPEATAIKITGAETDPEVDEEHLYQGFYTISWPSTAINLGTLLTAVLMHEDVYSSFDSEMFPTIFTSVAYMGYNLSNIYT